jgi:predicted lysophospholipase L1 biosynthesis ABC-type transport system permease subunit
MLEGPAATPGTEEAPIPAIISRRLPAGSRALLRGDHFGVTVQGQDMIFEVVGERLTFPGVSHGTAFVVAPFDQLQAAYRNPPLQPTALFVSGTQDAADALTAHVRERSPSSTLVSRHGRYAALRDAPLIAAVANGFRVALVVAALYTALAVVAALTLTAARRAQDLSFLRTLGLSSRQALGLTIMEHGPPIVLALVPGIALGVAVAALLAPRMGLTAFIGPSATFEIQIDWPTLALVTGALVGVVAVAIAASTWLIRRNRPTDALRIGDD